MAAKRRFVINWEDLDKLLPIGTDFKSKQRRLALFKEFDSDDKGLMHQTEATRSFFRLLPRVGGIVDMRPVWLSCFRIARESVEPIVPIGKDFLERNQFRVLIICVWYYLKLWDCFLQDSTRDDDVVVDFTGVERIPPLFEGSGIKDLGVFEDDLHAAFACAGNPQLPFDKLADMVLRRALPELAAIDESERDDAIRHLKRIQPVLWEMRTSDTARKAHSLDTLQPYRARKKENASMNSNNSMISSSPSVMDPYVSMRWKLLSVPIPGSVQKSEPRQRQQQQDPLKQTQRWNTQYMADYAPSAASTPHNIIHAQHTSPHRQKPRASFALRPSASLPEIGRNTLRHCDRSEVQSRLNGQLDMCSTGQMRNLLKAAGGMALART